MKKLEFFDAVVKNIKRYAACDGGTNSASEISRTTGIPISTLSVKLRNPRLFTLYDLYTIAEKYKINVADLTNFDFQA